MDSDEKDLENIEKIFAAGEGWLRKYGVVNPTMHNTIILNLRARFDPIVKNLEYFIDLDNEKRKIDLTLYVDVQELLYRGKGKYIKKVTQFLPNIKTFLKEDDQERLDKLLDVLPNSELPIVKQARERLIEDVHSFLGEYLHGYQITIHVRRHK